MSGAQKATSSETATNLLPLPDPHASWANDDPEHPGFIFDGVAHSPGKKAYLIILEAKPGKEDLVLGFLQDIHNGVDQEPGTGPWFGWRYSKTTFGIFEAFADSAGRDAHDAGAGGQNFFQRSELLQDMLAYPAHLYRVDILHGKFNVMFGQPIKPA